MMEYRVYENDYVSKYLGTFELPEGASEEQIDAAVDEILQQNSMGSLCYHCATSVGDLSGSGEITVEDEDGQSIRDDSYQAVLGGRMTVLRERIDELEKQLDAAQKAHAALIAQAEEVALLREWYAADQAIDAAEVTLRERPDTYSKEGFRQAVLRKWAAEDALRAALKGVSNEP